MQDRRTVATQLNARYVACLWVAAALRVQIERDIDDQLTIDSSLIGCRICKNARLTATVGVFEETSNFAERRLL